MSINDLSVFGVLRGTMGMLTQRQRLLAENIANADTPGFTPSDVDEKKFQQALQAHIGKNSGGISMRATMDRHFTSPGSLLTEASSGPLAKVVETPGSETTLNGNSVVLEEQVASLAETRMRYDTAIGLYQKNLSLLRLALKAPGR